MVPGNTKRDQLSDVAKVVQGVASTFAAVRDVVLDTAQFVLKRRFDLSQIVQPAGDFRDRTGIETCRVPSCRSRDGDQVILQPLPCRGIVAVKGVGEKGHG